MVTGATGFIGSNLLRRLPRAGWEVHAVVRANSDVTALGEAAGEVHLHEHDGTMAGMLDLMGRAKPDVVFHLASLFLAQHRTEDVDGLVNSNVLFGTQLAEAMSRSGVRHLINTGTSWQHFLDSGYNPVNLYAACKQAFEDVLAYYVEAEELNVTTLALFDTYGPGDMRKKLIPMLWQAALSGQTLTMSPGEQLVDLVYISDVVDAFLLAAERVRAQPPGHYRYGISSGRPMRLLDVVSSFRSATGESLDVVFGGRPYRKREVMVPWADYETLPGWRAQVPFDVGIRMARPAETAGA